MIIFSPIFFLLVSSSTLDSDKIKQGNVGLISKTLASLPSPRLAASGVNHEHRFGSSTICMSDGVTSMTSSLMEGALKHHSLQQSLLLDSRN